MKKYFNVSILILYLAIQEINSQNYRRPRSDNVVAEMQVLCRSDSIILKVDTNTPFNGMIYAKDAPSGGNCVAEYNSATNMTFRLPLKSCGTLFAEADDGIEYFNTVIVQPHMRLMTNQGKGYHIRCKYQTRERTIANTHFNVSASFPMQNAPQTATTPLLATASMPSCTMKIFRSGRDDVAEAVKIGDKLIMVIEIDQQDMYGMKISNCVVRDGLNVAEQQLINDLGCPIDENIMPKFEYTNNFTRAAVSFPAHKFPHTSSVYYQCNVRLCINNGGCNQSECGLGGYIGGGPRRKRMAVNQVDSSGNSQQANYDQTESQIDRLPKAHSLVAPDLKSKHDVSFDVYSGLYVNDLDVGESGSSDSNARPLSPTSSEVNVSKDICMTFNQTTPIILIASLGVIATVLVLLCQVGVFGRNQHVANKRDFNSTQAKVSPNHNIRSHHDDRRLYHQYYRETIA